MAHCQKRDIRYRKEWTQGKLVNRKFRKQFWLNQIAEFFYES